MSDDAIPLEWVKQQIDAILRMAEQYGPNSPMGAACAVRAEYYMDLVQAWKESRNEN